jgi:beta-lactamase regulating signal transducer with metallopeptidase domain
MTQLFKAVLSVSLSGAVIALFVLALRSAFLGRIHPFAYVILWGILALRLILPFSFESRLSLYNYAPKQVQEVVAAASFAAASPQTDLSAPKASFVPEDAARERFTPAPDPLPEAIPSPAIAAPADSGKGSLSIDPWRFAAYVWAFGSGALLLYMIFLNTAYYFHIKKNRRYNSAGFDLAFSRARENAGLKSDIAAYAIGPSASPSVFGLFRPRLLIPFKTFEDLSQKQQEYILTHELFHIRFGDNWSVLIMNIICAIHWFNPIIWLARHYARKDMELMCDARTLKAMGGQGEDYAGALILAAEKLRARGRTSLMIAAVDKKRDIRWRIKMVMKQKGVKTSLSLLSCLLALAIAAVGCTSAVQAGLTTPTPSPSPPAHTPTSTAPSPSPSEIGGTETGLETLPLPEGYTPLEMPENATVLSQEEYKSYPDTEKWSFSRNSYMESHGYAVEDIARAIWANHDWKPSEKNIIKDGSASTAYLFEDTENPNNERLRVSDGNITYYTGTPAASAAYDEDEAAEKAQEWMRNVLGDIPLLETAPEKAGIWPHSSLYWVLVDKNELGQEARRETLSASYNNDGVYDFNYYIEATDYAFQPLEGVALTLEQALHSFNYQRATVMEKGRNALAPLVNESLRISDISLEYRLVRGGEDELFSPQYVIECYYNEAGYVEPLHAYFLMDCQTGNLEDTVNYNGNVYDYYGNLLLLSPYPQINGHELLAGREKDALSIPAPGGGSPLTVADASKMVEDFDNHMNLSLYTMESPNLPDYAIDSASVHLFMRWFDYRIAMLEHPYNADERYALPSSAEANLALKEHEESRALYELSLWTHQKRLNNGVNGAYMLGEVEFIYQDGGWKISEFDIQRGLHRVFETFREMAVEQNITSAEGVDRLIDAQIDYFKKNN